MEQTAKQFRTADLAYTAVGAALIAVCSWISIPLTVPVTMQTFAVFLVLTLLSGKRGTAAVLVYILMGTAGLPVFSGFSGGIGVLLGTTGGYILGFLLTALIYWGMTALFGERPAVQIAALLIGLLVCYAFGTAWFLVVYTHTKGAAAISTVLLWCVVPFIIPDLLKLAAALVLSRGIMRRIN